MTLDKSETTPAPDAPAATQLPGFRPLYRQVKDSFLKRLVDGVWQPGLALPSEGQLAQELGVSQGTVRKALDEMAAERLLVRRQGRGTFVAEHDEQRILFQFFKLAPDEGTPSFPDSRLLGVAVGKADAAERRALLLAEGARVVRIRRLRSIEGEPLLVESITLPEALFSGLAQTDLPNNLYALYAVRYGIAVARAQEKIKAVALSGEDAAALSVPAGQPALLIDRVALSIDGAPVEWRRSLCLTEKVHYLSELR